MRRLVFLCLMVLIASALVAHSFPRDAGDASAPSGASQETNSSYAASAPVLISTNVMARSLAIAQKPAAIEGDGIASLYLTTADQPNRVFELGIAGPSSQLRADAVSPSPAPIAGIGEAGSLGDGGPATAAQMSLKLDSLLMRSGVAAAYDGTLFIADTRNATIRRIAGPASTEPGIIRSLVGRWAPHEDVELIEPMGIALDREGNLYIADHGANQVLKVRAAESQSPGPVETLAHVSQPASLSVTSDGSKVYVASPEIGAVFAIDTKSRAINSIAGFVSQPSACLRSHTPNGEQPGVCAAGLAVDGARNIFIADAVTNHIIRVDAKTSGITSAASHLAAPGEIMFDPSGNLFVADQGHNSVIEFRALGQPANSVTLSPASNDFGVEPIGGTSPTAAFTLTNNTNAALTGLAVNNFQGTNPGDFQTSSSSCISTLAPNSSCMINVAFVPITTSSLSAQLAVTYAGAPALTADLTGVGADYQLALAGTQNMSVTVVAGTTATYMLKLVPDSNFPSNSPYTVTFVSPPIATSTTAPDGELPALTTATFAPTSVTVTPGSAAPFTLTIETTSRVTGVLGATPAGFGTRTPGPWRALYFPALIIVAAMAALLGSFIATFRGAKWLRLGSMALLYLAAAGLIGGCGGGGKAKIIGTQPGTANFLVQATVQNAQGASLNVTRGIPLQLVVQ